MQGIIPSDGVKVRHFPVAREKLTNNQPVTWKRCKIGGKLVLFTNRKSYVLSIGTSISDLE